MTAIMMMTMTMATTIMMMMMMMMMIIIIIAIVMMAKMIWKIKIIATIKNDDNNDDHDDDIDNDNDNINEYPPSPMPLYYNKLRHWQRCNYLSILSLTEMAV